MSSTTRYDISLMRLPIPAEPPDSAAPGILVVDDHDLVRLGLRSLLLSHLAEVGVRFDFFEARTLRSALDTYREHRSRISLVLLDLQLADAHGLTGLQAFRREFPDARVVVLSGSTDPLLRRRSQEHGALAYLAKSADLQHVVEYLLVAGLPPVIAGAEESLSRTPVDDKGSEVRVAGGRSLRLSRRQLEVLELVLSGHSNRTIAEQTRLSEGTVKNHVSALLLMFGARSRAQLISQLR